MAKIGYRFNPDTLSYDKIEIPLRKKIGRLLRKFFSSLSLAVVIFFIVSAVIDSPKEKALRREKQEILAQYHLLNNEVSRLDAVLKNLEERDDNIYRVIFEAEPIDDAIRRAGTGGVNKYESLKNLRDADLIVGVSKKLDELSKALYKREWECLQLRRNPCRHETGWFCKTGACGCRKRKIRGCADFSTKAG